MNFAGLNLDKYMSGNSFDDKTQGKLMDAVSKAKQLNFQTFGNLATNRILADSQFDMAKAGIKAGAQIEGIMQPANTLAGFADIGTTLMSTDFSKMGTNTGSSNPFGFDTFSSNITRNTDYGDLFRNGGAWQGIV